MLANNNDLLILLIGLLVLLLIVVLIAASQSKSNKPSGGGGSKGASGRTGTGGSGGPGASGGGGIYIDSSLREDDDREIVERKIPEDADSGHDIVRIYVDRHREGLIVCPNCDAENFRGATRCAACGHIL